MLTWRSGGIAVLKSHSTTTNNVHCEIIKRKKLKQEPVHSRVDALHSKAFTNFHMKGVSSTIKKKSFFFSNLDASSHSEHTHTYTYTHTHT